MADKPEPLNREDLFDRLSPEGQEAAPVAYRFFHPSTLGASTILRLVESRPYRTAGYVCNTFRKPVSKCCEPDDV
jgi:hypothetical protein